MRISLTLLSIITMPSWIMPCLQKGMPGLKVIPSKVNRLRSTGESPVLETTVTPRRMLSFMVGCWPRRRRQTEQRLPLDAVCPRIDVAYLWKVTPTRGDVLSEEETAILREYWPTATRLEVLQRLPTRTWRALQRHASVNHLYREHSIKDEVPLFACFLDFMPKLDGQYLFRDYETTLQYVKIACDNTAREEAPLYALWLLSEKVEDLANLFDGDLNLGATSLVRPTKSVIGLEVSSVRKKMKTKGFAAGVNREDLVRSAAEFGVDLDEHIAFVIQAMSSIADTLGLAGVQEPVNP
jgi:hypothetical protein